MLVSICMPMYNCAPFIGATLDALREQTHQQIEVIVINDGSKDDSLAVARRHAWSKVRVETQENAGQCAAENAAIRLAQGDFFIFLDADDFMSPRKIERQVALLGDPSVPLMATCAWGRFHSDPITAEFRQSPLWRDLAPVDWLTIAWENHLMMHGATWLIPRPVVERAGPWDERLSLINDHEYFPRIMLQTEKILFEPNERTYYRSGFSSLSGQKSRKAWESATLALVLSSERLLALKDTPEIRHAIATKFQRHIYELYPEHADFSNQSADWVRRMGGSDVKPMGGGLFQKLSRLVGWKLAKRIQLLGFKLGYGR
jgi:glycosyltransferase involved in cell wall biosynthesis